MGDSCSKMKTYKDLPEESEDSPTRVLVDKEFNHMDNPPALPPTVTRHSILRRTDDTPLSPTQRASNYNNLQEAVKLNFAEARGGAPVSLGITGLRNLGNTCFLNSSLQCLSATIPLTDYFLGYDYRSEINATNALGTGGKLVVAYAELMKEMWLSKKTVVHPKEFKMHLERFAPQFRGFHQHDSQELLSFLLDGIHEGACFPATCLDTFG